MAIERQEGLQLSNAVIASVAFDEKQKEWIRRFHLDLSSTGGKLRREDLLFFVSATDTYLGQILDNETAAICLGHDLKPDRLKSNSLHEIKFRLNRKLKEVVPDDVRPIQLYLIPQTGVMLLPEIDDAKYIFNSALRVQTPDWFPDNQEWVDAYTRIKQTFIVAMGNNQRLRPSLRRETENLLKLMICNQGKLLSYEGIINHKYRDLSRNVPNLGAAVFYGSVADLARADKTDLVKGASAIGICCDIETVEGGPKSSRPGGYVFNGLSISPNFVVK